MGFRDLMLEQTARVERRRAQFVDWDPKMKWVPALGLTASSWRKAMAEYDLFPDLEPGPPRIRLEQWDDSLKVVSGDWVYSKLELPAGEPLRFCFGRQKGRVWFDEAVVVPRINLMTQMWSQAPFMSTTPQEFMTLRGGTRLAKGDVVLGGLGMGVQLIDVMRRPQVKRCRVVERDEGLVDLVWEPIKARLGDRASDVELIMGDARELIPKMTADRALIDIYPDYGGNTFPECPNVGRVWVWGSADIR